MLNQDFARELTPGTRVWSQVYVSGQVQVFEWEVYKPEPMQRWDFDPSIVNYIRSVNNPEIHSFIFLNSLQFFYTRNPGGAR